MEPGRRTRLRRYARTGRRADRDSRPARRRSSRTPLQSPGSAARFRPIHGGSASGPRRLPSARRTVQEDLRLRESRPGLRGESRENSSDRPPASQGTSSRAHPVLARRRISAPQGFRSGPSRISARRPRRDRQRSADGGAAHPGESGRIGPLPAAKMLNPNTPTSFPSTSERMRQPPRRRRNEGGPKRRPEPTTGPARRRNAENFRISTMILRSRRRPWRRPKTGRCMAPDKGKRKAWTDRIRKQPGAGRVELAIAALKPRRDRSEAVAACIRTCEAGGDRMRCDPCRTRGLPTGSGIAESACNCIARTGSNSREAAGRKRAPTPCPPSDAASKTCVGPTSSIGGLAAPQPPNQRKWTAPHSERALARGLDLTYVPPSRIHSVRETVLPICPYEAGGCGPSASRRRS